MQMPDEPRSTIEPGDVSDSTMRFTIRSLRAKLGAVRRDLRIANEMVDEYAAMLEEARAAHAYDCEVFKRRIAGEFVAVPKPVPKPVKLAELMARSEEPMP